MNNLEKRFESIERKKGSNPDAVSINKAFKWSANFWDIEEKIKIENKGE
ncbi:MAG: hypothetical protein HY831_04495 [Candidatus Aenigmarchaeota archaeon]|nr:hypothetical protein [Candidatus Aenigmarchaeota archaeon]